MIFTTEGTEECNLTIFNRELTRKNIMGICNAAKSGLLNRTRGRISGRLLLPNVSDLNVVM